MRDAVSPGPMLVFVGWRFDRSIEGLHCTLPSLDEWPFGIQTPDIPILVHGDYPQSLVLKNLADALHSLLLLLPGPIGRLESLVPGEYCSTP